ncbi:MAG: Mth938-like domain-containing protein [Rhodospirillaceae bacterium]
MKPPGSGPLDKSLPAPDPAQVQVIRTYGPGHFQISDRDWREPVLVTPTATTPWSVKRAEDLSTDNVAAARGGEAPAELLVVGCGNRSVFVPPAVRAAMKDIGLSLEVVDTGSACRIYNVLLAEGRRVAAALIPL